MPAYVIADATPHDPGPLEEYRRRNTEAVAKYGGRFIVRGGAISVLEGDWDPQRIVIMEFPDVEAARAWYESDDYRPLIALRRSASDTNIILVEGAD